MDLYSGPTHIIHYKYSLLLNTCYVTMLYGLGLPILFPIAAFSYFVFWVTERYAMAYTYHMPPQLDDALTQNMLKILSYSPILFLFNGLWMLSNKQIFESTVNPIPSSDALMKTGHTVEDLFNDVEPFTPLLMICFAFTVIVFFRIVSYPLLKKWGYTLTKTEIVVDEDLPNFF